MKSKWVINIEGLESYRFGEDKNLYRLPSVTSDGKHRGWKLIKKDKIKNRWALSRFNKVEKFSQNQLRSKLILDSNPVIITQADEMPF